MTERPSEEERDSLAKATEAVELLQAKARVGNSVYMGGEHNPLPSERQKARMFVEDHIAPLEAEVNELRERAEMDKLVKDELAEAASLAESRVAQMEGALRYIKVETDFRSGNLFETIAEAARKGLE